MAPDITCRNQLARRLVRAKLCRELSVIEGRQTDSYQYDNLPRDPCNEERKSRDESRSDADTIPPRKVCIVGAGVAGLYIAMILDDLKIPKLTYDILEANSRVGGRAFTHRFTDQPHDYYDVGAMRFPKFSSMWRTFDLFERTKVPTIPYYLDGGASCPSLFNDRFFVPGVPDPYSVSEANGGSVPNDVVDNVAKILEDAFGYYKQKLAQDFEAGFRELMEVDDFSTREYLKRGGNKGEQPHYNFYAIQWMETQNSSTNIFDQAFSESVMDAFDFDNPEQPVNWFCIEGGTSLLTEAMQTKISTKVQKQARVSAISIDRSSSEDGNMSVQLASEDAPREGYSTVFATTTLACLLRVDLRTLELHPSQKDAIRTLHYDDAAKVALKFSYPWWIVDSGITQGGVAYTDLPLRVCVYPSYNLHDGKDKPAVLLASYTWSQDATRVGSLIGPHGHGDEKQLVELILRDLARLHSKTITYEKIKAAYLDYHAWSWPHDPYTSGAYALFGPGQFSNLYPYLVRPAADSKFHMVGEASSAHHAWIVGALDSAYLAVYQFLYRYKLWDFIDLLKERWGDVDELEDGEFGTLHIQDQLGRQREDEHVRC